MRGKHGNHCRGESHHRWSVGRMTSSHGYVKIRVGLDHPLADGNGYAYEHEVVWASAGREMPSDGELLHHRTEEKTDNRLDNLEIKGRPAHGVHHQPGAISDEGVRRLREEYASGEHTGILAKRYGVSIQTAWKYVRGKKRLTAGGPISPGKRRAGSLLDGVEHNGQPRRPA